jgi:transposase
MTRPIITSERIDDVPLLIQWLLRMHIDKIIDAVLGVPHGNRQGLSYGQLTVVFIAYILTECNHFLSPVRDWVMERRECLSQALGPPIRDTDFTDDRLEDLLDALGADDVGEQIEVQMGQHLIRAYELPTDTARIDTTTASVYHQPKGESLLTFGQSKDRRPGLRQFKEALGTLDPAGIPLCSATVSGQQADDPLYLPAWRQIVQTLGSADFLVVGDCKMASLENRARIQEGNGYYLAPLPLTGNTASDLRCWVLAPPTTPVDVYLPKAVEDDPPVGQGFEVGVSRDWTNPQTGEILTWDERVLVLRSLKLARNQQLSLAGRLAKAERALNKLKAGPDADLADLTAQSKAILEQYHVVDYLQVTWTPHATQKKRYLKRGRHGPNSPFEMVTTTTFRLTARRQPEAIETFNRLAGWRLYATNVPAQRLDLTGAVACYRGQWQPERSFHRLKGATLAIRPLLLRSDTRICGLLGVLVIALRALTLFELVARRSLEQQAEPLRGLYAGNPKRATEQPTTERLLKAFDGLTLYRLSDGQTTWYEVTPLSALQQRILELVGIPRSAYSVPGGSLLAGP